MNESSAPVTATAATAATHTTTATPTAVVRPAYFVSDSTGITAETLGSALLANFPDLAFSHRTVPFVASPEQLDALIADIAREDAASPRPLVFATIRDAQLRARLETAPVTVIDLLGGHLHEVEVALGATASDRPSGFHALGDLDAYHARMRAVEFAIEHDDGASLRALDAAEVIIIAPSRCGKTPTTMYLALQHGVLVANYPLTDDDFPTETLPRPIAPYADRCFGLTTTPLRLSQVRGERRPTSRYASLAQCAMEIRRAEELYRRCGIPFLNSSSKSVEEMSAVILQAFRLRR
ncbi:pyruvate, water dikinase regulatory protein [Microbacterium sp. bgisy203]|uniref:pyruvate, water dikinase regulatory protein n=1 Tax=Microbacterium sp. bgisy203 TaxID=3413799 RepID=UPI003D74288A